MSTPMPTGISIPCPAIAQPTKRPIGLPALLTAGTSTIRLPTETRRLLPSLSSLADEDVAHRREFFLVLAERVDAAVEELRALDTPTDPAEVVSFMTMVAERRGMTLPSPTLLALDAQTIAAEIPADLFPVACARLWARFAYRRLPEPSDFLAAVKEELAERREAAAKVSTGALKVAHARWLEQKDAEARKRHAMRIERERVQAAQERLHRQSEAAKQAVTDLHPL
jgi:ADP-ribose pyrophosphatase YjhB (NUDIX family)